jgi:hypothetical protein
MALAVAASRSSQALQDYQTEVAVGSNLAPSFQEAAGRSRTSGAAAAAAVATVASVESNPRLSHHQLGGKAL